MCSMLALYVVLWKVLFATLMRDVRILCDNYDDTVMETNMHCF